MDRGAWQAAVRGVEKSWTGLSGCHSLGTAELIHLNWAFPVREFLPPGLNVLCSGVQSDLHICDSASAGRFNQLRMENIREKNSKSTTIHI